MVFSVFRSAIAGAFALMLVVSPAFAQERPDSSGPGKEGVLALLPADNTTEHRLDLPTGALTYTATAGTFSLFDQSGDRSAAITYTAYVLKGADAGSRPVTFVFNGGPGASSAYLHLGVVGPKVVDFSHPSDAAMARLHDNPDTWLRFTDLVLIDPVGAGWSRAAKADKASDFWSVGADAASIAKVIALYVSKNSRGGSPKYLLGESYGGFRSVKVAKALQEDQGILVSGITMLSPFLEGRLMFGDDRFALQAALKLPTLAAAEMDRTKTFSPEKLAEAERFALGDYLSTLAGKPPEGEAGRAFFEKVSALTGVPYDVVERTRGFVGDEFRKRAKDGTITSSYDAGFVAPDPFPGDADETGSDPVLDGFTQALGGLSVGYMRDELGFKTDMTFNLLNREVAGKWEWGRGGMGAASIDHDLRELLALNPKLTVFVAHGHSDAVTPYAVSRYVLDHLPTDGIAERTELRTYKGGHMFYFDPTARAEFAVDVGEFYRKAGL